MLRNVKLALHNLAQNVVRQTKSLAVIVLCFALALFSLIYMYAYYTGVKKGDVETSGRDTYVVNVKLPALPDALPVISPERHEKLLEYIGARRLPDLYAVRYEGTTQTNRYEGRPLSPDHAVGRPYQVVGMQYWDAGRLMWGLFQEARLMQGRWLRRGDMGKNRAVVHWTLDTENSPDVSAMPPEVTLMHDDTVYQTVGMADFFTDTSGGYCIVIPIDTYIEKGYPVYNVTLLFSASPNVFQRRGLKKFVNTELFPGGNFVLEAAYSDDSGGRVSRYAHQLATSVYMGFLACVNALALFIFWMRNNMRQSAIYMMHGLSAPNLKWTLAMEVGFITMIGFSLGLAVFFAVRLLIPGAENYLYALRWWEPLVMMLGIEAFVQLCVDVAYLNTYTNDALISQVY
ncbi:MAG: hypothetical protein ACOX88_09800 [Christensenellales bacterium]